jgi:Integrase zinc binding domain
VKGYRIMDEVEYNKIIENIQRERNYEIIEEVLYKKKNNEKLRVIRDYEFEGIMYMMHDNELSAHFGIEATYERINERYWWKNMRRDIEVYVKTCYKC